MSRKQLKQRLNEQNKIKWEFIENTLSDDRVERLQEQLKGVTMSEDEDGNTVIPSRDVRKAIQNPGRIV